MAIGHLLKLFYICSMSGLHIIWFRQDLRVHDNAALRAASQAAERDGGKVMALFVMPPAMDAAAIGSDAEATFLFESVRDLQAALAQRGAVLHLRRGEVTSVLSDMHRAHQVMSLHLHDTWMEDANLRGVEAWSLRAGIPLRLHKQFSPYQNPIESGSWQTAWERFMARPRHEAPDMIATANVGIGQWPRASTAGSNDIEGAAPGGRKPAIQILRAFLGAGQAGSQVALSSVEAVEALKPHLKLGAVSPREVWQAAVGAHQQALKAGLDIRAASIASFLQLLPALFRPQSKQAGSNGVRRRASNAPSAVEAGQQLSLGLGQSVRSNDG